MFLLTAYYVIFYMCLLFTLWRMNKYKSILHYVLANVISNVFESLILLRCEPFLLQQIINLVLSRDTALIYTLKEYIEFYKLRNTSVFVTFLEASKAFDRIEHWLLF